MEITAKRVRFSEDLDNKLRFLKSKTGVTPNILCRIGFCMSLEEPGAPRAESDEGGREINRHTLMGELDGVLTRLLVQRMVEDSLPSDDVNEQFRAHMHRGVNLLSARCRGLGDLLR